MISQSIVIEEVPDDSEWEGCKSNNRSFSKVVSLSASDTSNDDEDNKVVMRDMAKGSLTWPKGKEKM